MREFEKMRAGLLYNCLDPEVSAGYWRALALCERLRATRDKTEQDKILCELVPALPATASIETPFFCDTGTGIELEANVRVGPGCVFNDTGVIHIGANTDIGPGCQLCTPHHPIDAELRKTEVQYAFPIRIGANCRLGANVIVCPGVSIGDNCVISPGSVVTRDIPPRSLAAGCPAGVVASLEEGRREDEPRLHVREDRIRELCASLETIPPDEDEYEQVLEALLPQRMREAMVMPPFVCARGSNITLGEGSFVNYNATFWDEAGIRIGSHTLIGPDCQLFASPSLAGPGKKADIGIGDDCWLGGGVTVAPGVRIGDRCIVAAGSVVCSDIPSDSLAAGCPAVVKRRLGACGEGAEACAKDQALPANASMNTLSMSELERMRAGLLYDFAVAEVVQSNARARRLCASLQKASRNEQAEIVRDLVPSVPESVHITPPFHCDHGHGLVLGDHVYFNADCVALDSGRITIGAHTLFGPKCQLYTPQHPIDYRERRKTRESALSITIGSNCWFGAGCVVCPGVRIGNNCVIAAGSVVCHDIPDNVLCAGRPAKIKRSLA